MSLINFKISIPTDEGFLGRECNGPSCKRYFKVHADSVKSEMHCPYCGSEFSNSDLHTKDQARYIEASAKEQATAYVHAELNKMLGNLAKSTRGNKFVKITHTPSTYRPKRIVANYAEKEVDTELQCPECEFLFQVYGVFGYCPGCSTENMVIYDANISIIRKEISASNDKNRALRHAYGDLISTFEHFCNKKSASYSPPKPSFQDLFEARRYFKEKNSIDILDGLSVAENLCIRRLFQKRHVYQHAEGMVTEKYVRKIPEDSALLGTKAELSEREFEEGCRVIRAVIGNLAGVRLR